MQLVHAAIAACPPLQRDTHAEARTFSAMLRGLDALLQRGTRLVLISDFAQLHEQDLPLLMRLAAHHSLTALQVADSAEQALPNVGMMRFFDVASGRLRWLDTGSQRVRNVFSQQAAVLQSRQREMFERIGVRLHRCETDEDEYELFLKVYGYE